MSKLTAFVLLFALHEAVALAQLAPPTQTIKRRHASNITAAWDAPAVNPSFKLLYYSIQETPGLDRPPVEFKQVPAGVLQASFVVMFHPENPRSVFYVISAIYEGTGGESFPSNTIEVERIGPPPQ